MTEVKGGVPALNKQKETDACHVDVLIIGAGLSGIAAAHYLKKYCPNKSYAILEARESLGGTWDLFRYPGIRSDSDLYTFGFSFAPWEDDRTIADGESILQYLKKTAEREGIAENIHFNHKVTKSAWDSEQSLWNVTVTAGPEHAVRNFSCSFLYMCTGYYEYDQGYRPVWNEMSRYKGQIVHPQHWPEYLDYSGKKVVVIGSGATAVTLVPTMAEKAAHITMLQRSPTYILSIPEVDGMSAWMFRNFPRWLSYGISRWKFILLTILFYKISRWKPDYIRRKIKGLALESLPENYDERHLTPEYNPWDQRVCLVPDGDLFAAIKSGSADIITDTIEKFTENGLLLNSGTELEADIIVTATGLNMRLMGGMSLEIDGNPVDISRSFVYKGMMLSDVPNLALSMGYTNAPWTLKCEMIARHVSRILNRMDAKKCATVIPRLHKDIGAGPSIGLTSGYVQRALEHMPKQGNSKPWKLHQNYILDLLSFKLGSIQDGTLEFLKRKAPRKNKKAEARQDAEMLSQKVI